MQADPDETSESSISPATPAASMGRASACALQTPARPGAHIPPPAARRSTLKECMGVHIRALAVLPNEESTPWPVPPSVVEEFERKHAGVIVAVQTKTSQNAAAIGLALNTLEALKSAIRGSHRQPASSRSKTASDAILEIGDDILLDMYRTVGAYGLLRWAPDLLGSAKSVYNRAHRDIALVTFEHAIKHGAYIKKHGLSIPAVQQNWAFVERSFHSYCYCRLRAIAVAERNKAGSHALRIAKNAIGARRKKLAQQRLGYMKKANFPNYMLKIVEHASAHSEDEEGPDPDRMDTTPAQPYSSQPARLLPPLSEALPSQAGPSTAPAAPAPAPDKPAPKKKKADETFNQRRMRKLREAKEKKEKAQQQQKEDRERAAREAEELDKQRRAQHMSMFLSPPTLARPAPPVYLVAPKPGRHPKFATVFRDLVDPQRLAASTQVSFGSRRRGNTERIRKFSAEQEPKFTALPHPQHVTLDWYDPAVFNQLSVPQKLHIMDATRDPDDDDKYRIALPVARHCDTPQKLQELCERYQDYEAFLRRYGDEVLAEYQFPSEEEIEDYYANNSDSEFEGMFSESSSSDGSEGGPEDGGAAFEEGRAASSAVAVRRAPSAGPSWRPGGLGFGAGGKPHGKAREDSTPSAQDEDEAMEDDEVASQLIPRTPRLPPVRRSPPPRSHLPAAGAATTADLPYDYPFSSMDTPEAPRAQLAFDGTGFPSSGPLPPPPSPPQPTQRPAQLDAPVRGKKPHSSQARPSAASSGQPGGKLPLVAEGIDFWKKALDLGESLPPLREGKRRPRYALPASVRSALLAAGSNPGRNKDVDYILLPTQAEKEAVAALKQIGGAFLLQKQKARPGSEFRAELQEAVERRRTSGGVGPSTPPRVAKKTHEVAADIRKERDRMPVDNDEDG
ncbi:hypothetical protein K525DRAFT_269592 [Schizophyllum commune Loenen D]|nr:hypothetical protein K525DRAFT_269592 [Schizophyllum commune Loenen D]